MSAPLTHAGGIVARESRRGLELLLVRSTSGDQWVLPKGQLEPGDRCEQAAVREVQQETGVVGEVMGEVGNLSYLTPKQEVRVIFYAMRAIGDAQPTQQRRIGWFTLHEALARLSHPSAQQLVVKADMMFDGRDLSGATSA